MKKDNTFSFLSRRYENPADLRDKKIQLRCDRRRSDTTDVIVYSNGQRLGVVRLLDAITNALTTYLQTGQLPPLPGNIASAQ